MAKRARDPYGWNPPRWQLVLIGALVVAVFALYALLAISSGGYY